MRCIILASGVMISFWKGKINNLVVVETDWFVAKNKINIKNKEKCRPLDSNQDFPTP